MGQFHILSHVPLISRLLICVCIQPYRIFIQFEKFRRFLSFRNAPSLEPQIFSLEKTHNVAIISPRSSCVMWLWINIANLDAGPSFRSFLNPFCLSLTTNSFKTMSHIDYYKSMNCNRYFAGVQSLVPLIPLQSFFPIHTCNRYVV